MLTTRSTVWVSLPPVLHAAASSAPIARSPHKGDHDDDDGGASDGNDSDGDGDSDQDGGQGDPDSSSGGLSSIANTPTSSASGVSGTALSNAVSPSHTLSTSAAVAIAVAIMVLLLAAFFGFFLWKRRQWHAKNRTRFAYATGYRSSSASPPVMSRAPFAPVYMHGQHRGMARSPSVSQGGSREGLVYAENPSRF